MRAPAVTSLVLAASLSGMAQASPNFEVRSNNGTAAASTIGSSGSSSGSSSSSSNTASSTGSSSAGSPGSFIASGIGISQTSSSGSSTITSSPSLSGNASQTGVDACWTSWDSWWAANDTWVHPTETFIPGSVTTVTTTENDGYTLPAITETATTETVISTFTSTDMENGFTLGTYTSTLSTVYTDQGETDAATTVSSLTTQTYTETLTNTVPISGPGPTPKCVLPSLVSQCNDAWATYISYESGFYDQINSCSATGVQSCSTNSFIATLGGTYSGQFLVTAPPCTQASINSDLCTLAQSNYLSSWLLENNDNPYGPGVLTDLGYTVYSTQTSVIGPSNTSYILSSKWPSGTSLAPGCTLGCARCAVTGGRVRLIYWPEGTASATVSVPSGGVVTAEALGTTFTSPTVYISFGSVYAADSCSGVGPTLTNVIAALPQSADLSSLWAQYPSPDQLFTASFNYTDLNSPVPQSIYNSQVRCADESAAYAFGNQGDYTNTLPFTEQFTCARTLPYEPLLVVPTSLLDGLNPAFAGCSADIRGLYDPPIPLTPVGNAASATVPGQNSAGPTTPAAPSNTPSSKPAQTPAPQQSSPPAQASPSANSPPAQSSPSAGGGQSQPASADPGTSAKGSQSGDPGASSPPQSTGGGVNAGSILASIFGGSSSAGAGGDPGTNAPGTVAPSKPPGSSPAGSSPAGASGAPPAQSPGAASQNPGGILASMLGGGSSNAGGNPPSTPPAASPVIVGGQTLSLDPASSGGVIIGGSSTLARGSATVISGVTVSAPSTGGIVVGGSTVAPVGSGSSAGAGSSNGGSSAGGASGSTAGQSTSNSGATTTKGVSSSAVNGTMVIQSSISASATFFTGAAASFNLQLSQQPFGSLVAMGLSISIGALGIFL